MTDWSQRSAPAKYWCILIVQYKYIIKISCAGAVDPSQLHFIPLFSPSHRRPHLRRPLPPPPPQPTSAAASIRQLFQGTAFRLLLSVGISGMATIALKRWTSSRSACHWRRKGRRFSSLSCAVDSNKDGGREVPYLPVLIVGAGPVGLFLSILLTKLGVTLSLDPYYLFI